MMKYSMIKPINCIILTSFNNISNSRFQMDYTFRFAILYLYHSKTHNALPLIYHYAPVVLNITTI